MLYKDLSKYLEKHKDKITASIKKKAEIYKNKIIGINLAISKQYYSYSFLINNIEGYNKEKRVVVLTYDTEFSNLIYVGCNCDGYKKNKICSHILAVYLWLESEYLKGRREIEQKIKEWIQS